MKKAVTAIVLGVFMVALSACELDKGNEGVTEGTTPTDNGGETVTPTGTYKFIRVMDDTTNEQLSTCTNPNPGADIDAVAVLRGGTIIGWASQVFGDELGSVCAKNTAANPNTALAQSDETDPMDSENLFVSLNGGSIVVRFADSTTGSDITLQSGDTIKVFEVPGTSADYYYVDACEDSACSKSKELGHGSGEATFSF